jgi:Tfp pilus assembly protein FimT
MTLLRLTVSHGSNRRVATYFEQHDNFSASETMGLSIGNGSFISSLRHNQKGFTLIEAMVTIVLLVAMLALSIGAYRYFYAGRSLDAAVREITTEIRHAQTMAVASGNTYRIYFDTANNEYVLQSRQGTEWINDSNATKLPGSVKYDTDVPPSFDGEDSNSVEFYARGVSESGQLAVKSFYGRTKTVLVDGETANVSITG